MKTVKTISNISYNTFDFFEIKIQDLESNGIIDYCYYIKHFPEDDELKEHIHFVLKPSARIDTDEIRQELYEFDKENPTLPLTCTKKFMPCNSMDDWLLYALHDISYLKSKGQYRKYHYKYTDLHSTDYDSLREDYNNINRKKYALLQYLEEYASEGVPFFRLVQDGLVPISQRAQYEHQYCALLDSLQAEKNNETRRILRHDVVQCSIYDDKEFDF